jgi:gliding-associated putative ABC transporter substrate-binding component GldG
MILYLSNRHFFRIDLTENQEYAMTDASINAMKSLPDIVTVKVFFSKELPPNLFVVRQFVEDILGEMQSYAKGGLNVIYLDPAAEDAAADAAKLGIPAVRMNILAKDKYEVKNGFLGIALIYGDKVEVLPVIESVQNVEYELVSSVKKLTAAEVKGIGFLTGHGEVPLNNSGILEQPENYTKASQALEKNYGVTSVNLEDKDALGRVSTLVIGGPKLAFSEKDLYALDQFIMRGGNVLFLLDGVNVDDSLQANVIDLNLDNFMSALGVAVEPYFVLDSRNISATFNQGYFNFTVPYPFFIKAAEDSFNKGNPMVSRLKSVMLPWASPLFVRPPLSVNASTLISTSDQAWLHREPFNLDPNVATYAIQRSRQSLAALIEGKFKSYFAGRELPSGDGEEGAGGAEFLASSLRPSGIIVVGSSRFLNDQSIGQSSENLTFFLNAVDYLTLDDTLLAIRPKVTVDRPIRQLDSVQRSAVKMAGMFFMPFVVVLYGILRSVSRRGKKGIPII